MKRAKLTITVLFCVGLFFGIVLLTNSRRPDHVAQLEFSLGWLREMLGTLLAVVTTLVIVVRALGDEPLSRLVPLLVGLFAALLLISVHWTITIPLGLVLVVYIAKETLLQIRGQTDKESNS